MARRLVLAAVAVGALSVGAIPASAGASCAAGPFEVGRGRTVTMTKDCFRPTVLLVDPGQRVTFANGDPYGHTIAGAAGTFGEAHRDLPAGDSATFTFPEEGVFPFFCTYHPGMVGAVVVGDGLGSAGMTKAGSAAIERADEAAPGAPPGVTAAPDPASGGQSSLLPTAAWGSAAAGAGFVGGLVLRRRRAR